MDVFIGTVNLFMDGAESSAPGLHLQMQHPEFLRGYQTGMLAAQADQEPLTDKDVIETLHALHSEGDFDKQGLATAYFVVGSLFGRVIGRMP